MPFTISIFCGQSISPVASEFPLGYSTRLSIKHICLFRQFPTATQRIICKPAGKESCALSTCGEDQSVLFQRQATEAGVSGARVLVTGGRREEKGGERGLVLQDCNRAQPRGGPQRGICNGVQNSTCPGNTRTIYI